MKEFSHKPVMLNECMQYLNIKDSGIYYDGTVGGGGHSNEILKLSSPNGKLVATDLDDDAIDAATQRLSIYGNRFKIYKSDYKNFDEVFRQADIQQVDGAILDFGVSSYQLDNFERGFSYMKKDAPLDMRMDKTAHFTAKELINTYSKSEIAKILFSYGEESFANKIAENIVKAREKKQIETCGELAEIIENSIPIKFKQNGPCARKSFQAIRIAVNGELEGLYGCIISLVKHLKKNARLVILTFHSLEDRIVKQAFKYLEQDCICSKNLPICVCNKKKEIEIITKKPITASEDEIKINSRSKCAKLRVAEKI